MSILPIEMSITVQRTVELNRTPSGETTARPELAQDEFAERFNREVRQREQQIVQSAKAEENTVNRDGRGNGGYAGGQRKKEKKHTKSASPGKAGSGGSLFDVSI